MLDFESSIGIREKHAPKEAPECLTTFAVTKYTYQVYCIISAIDQGKSPPFVAVRNCV